MSAQLARVSCIATAALWASITLASSMSRSRRTEGVPADRSARIRARTRALAAAPLGLWE